MLRSLSAEEWKAFEKFTASPYFNKGRNYLPLLKVLKSYTLKINPKIPDDEIIYSKLYPGKPFNNNVVNTMLSGFTKMTESFLVQTDYDTLGEGKDIAFLRQLEKRNCDNLLLNEIEKLLKKNDPKPFDLFKLDFLKSIQDYIVRSTYKSIYDKKIENPVIRRADYSFFAFYLNMLNEERDLRVMKNMLNKSNSGRLSAIVVKKIDHNYVLNYIDEYYPSLSGTLGLLIRCFVSRDYYLIKKLFMENYWLLETTMARNISYVIEGLLFDLLAEGKKEFLKERFTFIKFVIEKNLIADIRSGVIPAQPVDNAIYYALWSGEIEWLESFKDKYKNAFPADLKTDLEKYLNACILYGKKQYADALKEIKLIGNVPFIIKWRLRSLELQLLFELNEMDAVYFAIDNFLKFINNETTSVQVDKMLKLNISSFKTFVTAYWKNNHEEFILIQKRLAGNIPSQFGDWILSKIAQAQHTLY